ncbi:MAG: hypothetical protein MZV63_01365 [Marinilabiliales bacterium]|nr:hypothetical protein [Marinilabiliales bacterium]
MKHSDAHEKVTGRAIYTGDLKLPGHASCQDTEATVTRSQAGHCRYHQPQRSMEGVKVVRDGDFIAVLSENRDLADLAVVRISAEYSYDEMKVSNETIL